MGVHKHIKTIESIHKRRPGGSGFIKKRIGGTDVYSTYYGAFFGAGERAYVIRHEPVSESGKVSVIDISNVKEIAPELESPEDFAQRWEWADTKRVTEHDNARELRPEEIRGIMRELGWGKGEMDTALRQLHITLKGERERILKKWGIE